MLIILYLKITIYILPFPISLESTESSSDSQWSSILKSLSSELSPKSKSSKDCADPTGLTLLFFGSLSTKKNCCI